MNGTTNLTLPEAERLAYISGDSPNAALIAQLDDSEESRLNALETLDKWENYHVELHALRQFFNDCFECLKREYPSRSIHSDYDKQVIFNAIREAEGT
jgi:hypothetical protein